MGVVRTDHAELERIAQRARAKSTARSVASGRGRGVEKAERGRRTPSQNTANAATKPTFLAREGLAGQAQPSATGAGSARSVVL